MQRTTFQWRHIINREKNRFLLILIVFFTMPTLSFGQDTTINVNNLPKSSYVFITEHGMSLGGDIVSYTGVFINNICFNKTSDIVGLGVGVEYGIASGLSIPIFANYRRYFPSNRNLKPLLNIAIGSRLTAWYGVNGTWRPDFYSTIASGFRVKAFSFTSGLYIKSLDGVFWGGFEIKLGYVLKYTKWTFKSNKKTTR